MLLTIKLINLNTDDWIGIVLITILFILTIINFVFELRFRKTLSLPLSKSYFSFYVKEGTFSFSGFNTLFFIVNLLTYSLLIYFGIRVFDFDVGNRDNLSLFFEIVIFVVVYFILKFLLSSIFNGLILNVKDLSNFNFYKASYRNFSSLVLFGLILLHQYSTLDKKTSLYILATVFTIVFIYGYLISAKKFLDKNSNSILHIILYLCALELAPFLIYGKYVVLNFL